MELKSGDLLFQVSETTGLSSAINEVTQKENAVNFSHVGILEIADDGEKRVLHANSEGGTCISPLSDFICRKITIAYRLKDDFKSSIPAALIESHKMLGKPYNYSYIMNDSSLYCSEFIYKAFLKDSIFELNPMTFKNPSSTNFNKTWIEYYKNLGIGIPENMPGCNPNGLASSDKLIKLGKLSENYGDIIIDK